MILIFWILTAYGMTNILVWGSIFENQRTWIKAHSKFFGDLISCVLCTSTWVGFFLSFFLGGITKHYFDVPWYMAFFTDGMLTAGSVWMLNGIIEFFEENRIK
jgi:hypothetical protein